jgi:hypothetical protein
MPSRATHPEGCVFPYPTSLHHGTLCTFKANGRFRCGSRRSSTDQGLYSAGRNSSAGRTSPPQRLSTREPAGISSSLTTSQALLPTDTSHEPTRNYILPQPCPPNTSTTRREATTTSSRSLAEDSLARCRYAPPVLTLRVDSEHVSSQVQLTAEQFERLYLQPGGTAAKGDAAKRYGNPWVAPHPAILYRNTDVVDV